MIGKVKERLRIKHNALEGEIEDLIDAAKQDLRLHGVTKIDETDPLIIQAIVVYCKANFGLDNKDSEKYQVSYEKIRDGLFLSGEYSDV